jgi:hypothetical protein
LLLAVVEVVALLKILTTHHLLVAVVVDLLIK